MKGDIFRCPKCGHTMKEADCEYTEVVCHRTGACRRNKDGCTSMTLVGNIYTDYGV